MKLRQMLKFMTVGIVGAFAGGLIFWELNYGAPEIIFEAKEFFAVYAGAGLICGSLGYATRNSRWAFLVVFTIAFILGATPAFFGWN